MNILSNESHPWSNLKLEFEEEDIKPIKNPKNKNIQSMHYSKPNSEYYYDIDKPKPKPKRTKSTCKHKCTIL